MTTLTADNPNRLGVDDLDSYPYLEAFVRRLIDAGCDRLYVHARRAILGKLSPAQNRRIPPLNYGRVHALAAAVAPLPVVINGGITTSASALAQLSLTHGVMLGRAAFHQPALLAELSLRLGHLSDTHGHAPAERVTQQQVRALQHYRTYAEQQADAGVSNAALIKPLLGLFHGTPGARRYRRTLSETAAQQHRGPAQLLDAACACLTPRQAA